MGLSRKPLRNSKKASTGDALGGNLYKKRVALGNKGKSGGLRTILVYKEADENVFCVHVFAKKDEDNITSKELEAFKLMADFLLGLEAAELRKSIETKILLEVK